MHFVIQFGFESCNAPENLKTKLSKKKFNWKK